MRIALSAVGDFFVRFHTADNATLIRPTYAAQTAGAITGLTIATNDDDWRVVA